MDMLILGHVFIKEGTEVYIQHLASQRYLDSPDVESQRQGKAAPFFTRLSVHSGWQRNQKNMSACSARSEGGGVTSPRRYFSSRARLASERSGVPDIACHPFNRVCIRRCRATARVAPTKTQCQNVTGSVVRPRKPRLPRQFARSETRRIAGMRRKSVLKAISPSSRARGAPKQKWGPQANARCRLSWRWISRQSGSAKRSGSRLAAPNTVITAWRLRIILPPSSTSSGARREVYWIGLS